MTRSRLSALLVLLLPSVALAQGVSFRQTFDTVNLALNKGDGYKTSSNNSGTLAWGESYIMMSYAVMFRGTGDPAYLLRLADHALSVLDQRDNKKGLKDFAGKSRPCWQSAKYSNNKKGYCWVVHSGMISYPMADLALLVQQNPKLGSLKVKGSTTLAAAAATVLAEVQKVVATHDFQYKSGPSSGEGHYRGDPAAGATIGTSLVRLSGTLTKLYPSGGILISDAEDVARAHVVAMERGTPGERYIIGTENTKYFLLLELLYTVSGFRPMSIPLPRFSAFLMGWLSDSFAKAFGRSIPSIPSLSVVKRTYEDLFLSSEKATLELGMTWTPLKETLDKTVGWLRKNRMI